MIGALQFVNTESCKTTIHALIVLLLFEMIDMTVFQRNDFIITIETLKNENRHICNSRQQYFCSQ